MKSILQPSSVVVLVVLGACQSALIKLDKYLVDIWQQDSPRIVWQFNQVKGKGKAFCLAVKADYTVPVFVLGRLAESLILKHNENEAGVYLANPKARMES